MVAATVGAVGGRGWAAAQDGPRVSSLRAGWVLAPMCRKSMVKRTKGAQGVGLLAPLGGVAEAVAVVALGSALGIDGFLNFKPLREEEAGREEFLFVVAVDRDNDGSRLFGYSSSSVLVKVPGRTDVDRFHVENG